MEKEPAPIPTVSVVMCAYNAAPYIAETLASVFGQTYQDFELILVNDGSTDDTENAIQPFLETAKQGQFLYLKQENKGPGAARNVALRVARGIYIAILDSDDIWLPTYLEKMVALMQANPTVDLYYPNAVFFGTTPLNGVSYQEKRPSSDPVTIEKLLKRECHVFISSVFKRAILDQVGMFDEHLRGVEDFDLWLRMLQQGYRFAFTHEILVRYRVQSNSLSGTPVWFYQQVSAALRKYRATPGVTLQQRQLADDYLKEVKIEKDLLLSKQEIAAHDFVQALKHLVNVLTARPTMKLKLAVVGLILFPSLLAWFMTRRSA